MSTCTDSNEERNIWKSRFVSLIRRYSLELSHTMRGRGFKLKDRCKTTQVHPSETSTSNPFPFPFPISKLHFPTINSILQESADSIISLSTAETFLPYGLPRTDSFEPPLELCLKSVDFVESLAELYRKIQMTQDFDKSLVYLEQYALLCSLGDPKLLRRCLK